MCFSTSNVKLFGHNYKQEHNILHVMETCVNCLTKVHFLNVNFTGFFALFMMLTETLKKACVAFEVNKTYQYSIVVCLNVDGINVNKFIRLYVFESLT